MAVERLDIVVTETGSRQASANIAGVSRASGGLTSVLGGLRGGLLGVAAIFLGGMGISSAVQGLRNFDFQMRTVQAAAQATTEELRQLSDEARRVGLATGEGAMNAARVMENLVKAGVETQQVLQGTAEAAIIMAQATNSDMAAGAETASNAMRLFGIEAENIMTVVQQATGVINLTTYDLNDYRLALAMSGYVARTAGVSYADFNATLAATAAGFSSGSDQGTAFKTFMLSLSPSTAEARAAIDRLGLSFRDAEGHLLPLDQIADSLRERLSLLTDEQRDNAIKMIFGNDAYRLAAALYEQGGDEIRRFRDELIPATDAVGQAATRFAGLEGSISRLNSTWEDFSITIGESGLGKFLADAINLTADLIENLNNAIAQFGQLSQASFDRQWGAQVNRRAAQINPEAFDPQNLRTIRLPMGPPILRQQREREDEFARMRDAARRQAMEEIGVLDQWLEIQERRRQAAALRAADPEVAARRNQGTGTQTLNLEDDAGGSGAAGLTRQQMIDQYNRSLTMQNTLLTVNYRDREAVADILDLETRLLEAGHEGLGDEAQGLLESTRAMRERQRQMEIMDQAQRFAIESIQTHQDEMRALNALIAQGGPLVRQYQGMLRQTRIDMLELRVSSGRGSMADGFLLELERMLVGVESFRARAGQSFGTFFSSLTDGFASSVGRAIVFSEDLGASLQQVARTALAELIGALIKMGIQWVLNATLGQSIAAASTAASVAEAAVVASAWAPAAAAVSLASYGANALPAMTGMSATYGLAEMLAQVGAGMKDGGYVSGPGGPRGDRVPRALSNGEFVVNAAATARNRAMLEAMNAGQNVGGGITVNMPITVNGDANKQTGAEIARQVEQAVIPVLKKHMRPGGVLAVGAR